jgi:two-component system, OmpR family, response regulator
VGLRKILYVEDDDDIRTVTVMALELLGSFEVAAHASGADALTQAEAFAPDLILLDVMMPGMDGPATLAGLRALPTLADTPAVFFTAKAQPDEVSRLRGLGARDVLAKPFDPQALPGKLEAIWNAARE